MTRTAHEWVIPATVRQADATSSAPRTVRRSQKTSWRQRVGPAHLHRTDPGRVAALCPRQPRKTRLDQPVQTPAGNLLSAALPLGSRAGHEASWRSRSPRSPSLVLILRERVPGTPTTP